MGSEVSRSEDALWQVLHHLRVLSDQIVERPRDLEFVRGLIDTYASVHPSTSLLGGQVVAVEAEGVDCEWLVAPGADPDARLLYIHGGSWMSGSLDGYRAHAARISAATGCSVLNVGYRLAPEHPYPAGLDDCDSVFGWMRHHGPSGSSLARTTVIAGDSAGGNLALALAVKKLDGGEKLPDALVALSPATDLSFSNRSLAENADRDPIIRPARLPLVVAAYLQDRASVDSPLVSPINGRLGGLPPLLLQVGEGEVLVDDSTLFAEKARREGVDVELSVWPEMPHVFQMFAPFLPQAEEALFEIGRFIKSHVNAV